MDIRTGASLTNVQIDDLYAAAFPGEDLTGLVKSLQGLDAVLSLSMHDGAQPIAHLMFSHCANDTPGTLLGPLAVHPDYQRQGRGTGLIREGLAHLDKAGMHQVFVLGDPDYYSRTGFTPEADVMPPYDLPAEWRAAWQSQTLSNRPAIGLQKLDLPEPWMSPALWLP